jgi:hypothetical protein
MKINFSVFFLLITGAFTGGIHTLLSGFTWCGLDEQDGGISQELD